MKLGKLTLGIITAAALLVVNCTAADKTVSEESLGLRTTTIYTEDKTTGDKTQYGASVAGTSTKIARAFENAPPMIPHDVEGMLPITMYNVSRTSSCRINGCNSDSKITLYKF